ncbi:MAG: hydroxymethylglutaryl-CoA lyase [Candidatus Sumerlaeia bacterium]
MKTVILHEVGPRDGLQMEKQIVPVEKKLAWLRALARTGVDIIQAGSFVHPQKVPQMADTDEIVKELLGSSGWPEGVTLSGLILNEKGLDRALACGCQMICAGVSASETHSRKNTGMTVAEATRQIIAAGKRALAAGLKVQVSVQSAFGCGYEGRVPPARVLEIARQYVDAGLLTISLADTMGYANPSQVEDLFGAVLALDPGVRCACHFHDTYGLGLTNCWAALRAGVMYFESAFAGLGGCPFTAVAGGNVCTEDLVNFFQQLNLRTDVALDQLIEIARDVAAFFGREMPGSVYKVGAPRIEAQGA